MSNTSGDIWLGFTNLFKRSFKDPVEKFIVGDGAAQYFADIFDIFDVND